jgi:hypothetical protein
MLTDAEELDKKFDDVEKIVDNMRDDLYRPFQY